MKNIFARKSNARFQPNNITDKKHDSTTNGDKNLLILGPKIWD